MTFPRIQVHTSTLTHAHMYTPTCTHPGTHTHVLTPTHTRAHTTLFVFVGCNWGSVFVVQEHDSSNLSSKAGENYFLWLKIRIFCQPSGEGRSSLSSHPVKLLGLNKSFFLQIWKTPFLSKVSHFIVSWPRLNQFLVASENETLAGHWWTSFRLRQRINHVEGSFDVSALTRHINWPQDGA